MPNATDRYRPTVIIYFNNFNLNLPTFLHKDLIFDYGGGGSSITVYDVRIV